MSKIMQSARGENCTIRIPEYCTGNPEQTVGAHYSLAGFSGKGFKSPHHMIAYSCLTCHMIVDGAMKTEYTKHQVRLWHCEGVFRTQEKLIEKGLISVEGGE